MSTRKKAKKALGSASPAGVHFLSSSRLCGHKHFLSYVLGLKPQTYARELLAGQAFHRAKEVFYLAPKARMRSAVRAGLDLLAELEPLYARASDYEVDAQRLEPMFEKWVEVFGAQDLREFDVLDVEKVHVVPLDHDFFLTVRMDVLVRFKKDKKHLRVMDTKTTAYSLDAQIESVRIGGQSRAYLLAARHLHPSAREIDMVADVVYLPKNSMDPARVECKRGDPILLPEHELRIFAEEAEQTLRENSARVQAFFSGEAPDHKLFPRVREPGICRSYNRPCEYFEICGLHLRPGEDVFGFEWDQEIWRRYESLRQGREV